MNLGEIRTITKDKGFDNAVNAMIDRAINAEYQHLAGMRRWAWLERLSTTLSTSLNEPSVSLAAVTDLMWVDAVRLELGDEVLELDFYQPRDFRPLEFAYPDPGCPSAWTEAFGELRFSPAPASVYTVVLDYITTPQALVDDTDTPLFDSTYHEILSWGAARRIAFRQRDRAAVADATSEYNVLLRSMASGYGAQQRQSSRQVRSGYWD